MRDLHYPCFRISSTCIRLYMYGGDLTNSGAWLSRSNRSPRRLAAGCLFAAGGVQVPVDLLVASYYIVHVDRRTRMPVATVVLLLEISST